MEVLKGFREIKKGFHKPVLTIGNFDGLHLGHQRIVGEVVGRARAAGGQSIVYTFNPHPQTVLAPAREIALIATHEEKLRLFEEAGVDFVVEEPFSREFSAMPPERFFSEALVKSIAPEAIYVGYDFGFGKDRAGSLEVLRELCAAEAIELHVAPPLKIDDEVCSSSRIRDHLKNGDVAAANRLLGRCFSYSGPVVRGNARGRAIGFPTANILAEPKIQVKNGVYASFACVGAKRLPSVTNIGVQPTFKGRGGEAESRVAIETHIFSFSEDIYGAPLRVELVERLRDEKKFPSVDALVRQIRADSERARQILAGQGSSFAG